MTSVERILVPTDFSRGARQVLRHAVVLADRLGAELHVLHVLDEVDPAAMPATAGLGEEVVRRAMQAEVHGYHRSLFERNQRDTLPTRCEVRRHADVAQAVADYARDERIDLIMIDWFERSLSDEFGAESTAEQVVQRAPCEVLTSGLRGLYSAGRAV